MLRVPVHDSDDPATDVATAFGDLTHLAEEIQPAPIWQAQLARTCPSIPLERVRLSHHAGNKIVGGLLNRRAVAPRVAGESEAAMMTVFTQRERGCPMLSHAA